VPSLLAFSSSFKRSSCGIRGQNWPQVHVFLRFPIRPTIILGVDIFDLDFRVGVSHHFATLKLAAAFRLTEPNGGLLKV
jgi:hypothetical protein